MLGTMDLDEFVSTNLKELADWEKNFKALKARGRGAEKLPRYEPSSRLEVVTQNLSSNIN